MKVYQCNKFFSIPENIHEKIFYKKERSFGKIYLLKNNNINLIMKIFNTDITFKQEYNNYLYVMKKMNNTFYKKFITNYLAIIKNKEEYIFFMKKNEHLINHDFLCNLNYIEKKNILFQTLSIIYTFNNIYSIYFNDIYCNSSVKNIMINEIKIPFSHKFKFNDFEYNIFFDKYIINIIDYGFITNHKTLNTIKYMKLYFNNLFNINIISEVLLYTFFFFISIHNKIDINIIMNNLNGIVKIIFNTNNKDYVIKNFDTLFIKLLFTKIELKKIHIENSYSS